MSQLEKQKVFIYRDADGTVNVNAYMQEETIWLTQAQMAQLFSTTPQNITQHIKKIYKEEEFQELTTCKKFLQVVNRGFRGEVEEFLDFYNLDIIITVGFRVNSAKARAFRNWAIAILREYTTKGFALDDKRLKNGNHFDKMHFRELLERIKEIRTSERMLYQQLKDIYALSEDYNQNNAASLLFFARVQDKVHYAITGQTAAEIVYKRADSEKNNMGLTTWKNAPDGRFYKSEVVIAKNYLLAPEMESLRDIINMFLDYAEIQAKRQIPIFMQDWIDELDNFLRFMKKPILAAPKYSRTQAVRKAYDEYTKYRAKQLEYEKQNYKQELIEDIRELEEIEKSSKQ